MKKVLITGIDGYIGYALAVHLSKQGGYEVYGVDNLSRRERVHYVHSQSIIPIKPFSYRFLNLKNIKAVREKTIDPSDVKSVKPDAVIHLGQMPSAPWSMKSFSQCVTTQMDNLRSNLALIWGIIEGAPETHLIKLGTMGEYGTPNCPIPEGVFPEGSQWMVNGEERELAGRLDGMMFPRKAGSWYHLSKVHDTHNVRFACDNYGIRATDIMQGVVYGTRTDSNKGFPTRFDIDECFGTVINRFVAQSVAGLPITPYGKGEQVRGFLPLRDVMQCLQIAIDNPPEQGEYRTWNQFDRTYSVADLSVAVAETGRKLGRGHVIEHVKNPRKEMEKHEYKVCTDTLRELGYYKPAGDLHRELELMFKDLIPHRDRILKYKNAIAPKTNW